MARPRGNWTLDPNSIEYLKLFPNQSKVLDEAIELHRNKDRQPQKQSIKNVRVMM